MKRAQPTPVELRYYGYADESITDEIIAFGSAVFAVDRVPLAEATIAEAKASIGLGQNEKIHSRVMFHAPAKADKRGRESFLKGSWAIKTRHDETGTF